jgi:hypothetical protein
MSDINDINETLDALVDACERATFKALLTASIPHDLHVRITAVLGDLRALRKDFDDSTEWLERAKRVGENAGQLLDDTHAVIVRLLGKA